MRKTLLVCLLMTSLTSCKQYIISRDLCDAGLRSTYLNDVEKAAIKLYLRESEIDKLVQNNMIIRRECE